MSKKLLTEDLILDKMEEKGIAELGSIDPSEMKKIVLKHYDAEITCNWGSADMYFTVISTADGYELYLATEDEERPYYEEDVYYYDTDWFSKLPDCIRDGRIIHVDEYAQEEYGFEEAIAELYEEYWDEAREEVEEELLEEGYAWPVVEK